MEQHVRTQGIITETNPDTDLLSWVEAFLLDRKVQNLSPGTIKYYTNKLALFVDFVQGRGITQVVQITPTDLRLFLLHLEEKGHNPGGIHACYRAVKCFLRWFLEELEPENWKNPTSKVKPPRVPELRLDPVDTGTFTALLETCDKRSFPGARDRAIFLSLLDTGARAGELLALDLEDVDQITGAVLIKQGKGRKSRTVYLGKTSRKALRAYIKLRKDSNPALFITQTGERLAYDGVRAILKRRAKMAGVQAPTLHGFRRAFALEMLRNGTDVYSLQDLMGHADLQILRRYLKQTERDLAQAHRLAGPVDHL